jgi:hypothetical protein
MNAQTREAVAPHPERARTLHCYPPLLPPLDGIVFCLMLLLLFRLCPAPAWPDAGSTKLHPATGAASGPRDDAAPAGARQEALLVDLRGDVELRDAQGRNLADAPAPPALHAGDAVRTLTRSRALLRLGEHVELELGERSQLAFAARSEDRSLQIARARRVTLLAGALAGAVRGARGDAVPLELELPGARLTILATAGRDGDVRFVARRNTDSTSTISLVAGRARLAAGHGAESITAGYGVTLDGRGNVRDRRALAPAPGTLAPPGGSVVAYRDVPPRVEFTWSPVGGVPSYRLRIARDAAFHDLLADERVDGASRTLSAMSAGEYYWSVSSVDGHYEGRPSVPRRLRIVQDSDAPGLAVDAVEELEGRVVVRGRTEAGARVYVQGEGVGADPDGGFETRIALRPGAFLLLVEAVDAAGNVSSRSRIVTAHDAEPAAIADAETGL